MQNKAIGKLLAKENITIQHGNYHTAWFDIKNRTLGLPSWADNGKDVYDLLIGHEVGHALYTPFEGWHDSPEKLEGCPRSYINVIEDARIEKLVRREYPGLVGPFLRGYKKLSEDNFFGDLEDLDFDEIKLIDKINLKSKLGRAIDVPFNAEEKALFDRAMQNETFEDVIALVRDVLAYTKENQEELMQPPEVEDQEEMISDDSDDYDYQPPQGHDDMDSMNSGETESENAPSTKTEEESEGESSSSTDETQSSSQEDVESPTLSDSPQHNRDEDFSITDEIFRSKESGLIERDNSGLQTLYSNGISKDIIDVCVIDHKTLAEDRIIQAKSSNTLESCKDKFNVYMKDTRKNVNFAVKEFEMRKAAHQWQRATTAKSGSLDVNKVHSYKYNEDIFARVTSLANSKNHGMMMIVDYSGSMSESMPQVLDQLMHLVSFCKAVNIPFEVYAFTTGNRRLIEKDRYSSHEINGDDPRNVAIDAHNAMVNKNRKLFKDASLDVDDLSMPLLVSSDLKKAEYMTAMHNLFAKMDSDYWYNDFQSKFEDWGSTPLNHALIVSHTLVKRFKLKHGIEKMNFVCLTDGDTNRLNVYQDRKLQDYKDCDISYGMNGLNIKVEGKNVKLDNVGKSGTKNLLENLRKRYNTNNLGFFMADDNRHFYNRVHAAIEDNRKSNDYIDYYSEEWNDLKKSANTEYRHNKCVVKEKTLGYNEYYIIKGGKKLTAQGDEAMNDITSDNTTAQVRNAFRKQAKSKKKNKVLLTRFGKAVA